MGTKSSLIPRITRLGLIRLCTHKVS